MPLQARRPNLQPLTLAPQAKSQSFKEEVHTPIPFTPMPFHSAPLVMTPDTPSFSILSLDEALSAAKAAASEPAYTDDEDVMIDTYLVHPPRPLSIHWPPQTLPPPQALDAITSQLISLPSWNHSYQSTRARLFETARQQSVRALGGHKRVPSVPITMPPVQATVGDSDKPVRPRMGVLGGAKMDRRMHSMDCLMGEGDGQIVILEALRLSTSLQVTAAKDQGGELHSNCGLSSPLTFSFDLTPRATTPVQATPLPSAQASAQPLHAQPMIRKATFPLLPNLPRPTSLLQRGKSFTSTDLLLNAPLVSPALPDEPNLVDELQSLVMTPLNLSLNLNPTRPNELAADYFPTSDPFTPLSQTFPSSLGLRNPPPAPGGKSPSAYTDISSNSSTPMGGNTPSITLTVDSPSASTSGRTRSTSPGDVGIGFAGLSLGGPIPISISGIGGGISPKSTETATGKGEVIGLRRVPRPVPLARSLSEGATHGPGLMDVEVNADVDVQVQAQMTQRGGNGDGSRPSVKRQKGMGLSVFVPRPGGSGWGDELRSPFEHKPCGGGQAIV